MPIFPAWSQCTKCWRHCIARRENPVHIRNWLHLVKQRTESTWICTCSSKISPEPNPVFKTASVSELWRNYSEKENEKNNDPVPTDSCWIKIVNAVSSHWKNSDIDYCQAHALLHPISRQQLEILPKKPAIKPITNQKLTLALPWSAHSKFFERVRIANEYPAFPSTDPKLHHTPAKEKELPQT